MEQNSRNTTAGMRQTAPKSLRGDCCCVYEKAWLADHLDSDINSVFPQPLGSPRFRAVGILMQGILVEVLSCFYLILQYIP